MGCSQNKSRIPISIALHLIYLMVLKMFVLISGGVNAQPESHYKQTGVPKAWPISKFLLKYTSNRKVTTSKMVSQNHNQFPSFFSSIRPTGKSPQAKWVSQNHEETLQVSSDISTGFFSSPSTSRGTMAQTLLKNTTSDITQ